MFRMFLARTQQGGVWVVNGSLPQLPDRITKWLTLLSEAQWFRGGRGAAGDGLPSQEPKVFSVWLFPSCLGTEEIKNHCCPQAQKRKVQRTQSVPPSRHWISPPFCPQDPGPTWEGTLDKIQNNCRLGSWSPKRGRHTLLRATQPVGDGTENWVCTFSFHVQWGNIVTQNRARADRAEGGERKWTPGFCLLV